MSPVIHVASSSSPRHRSTAGRKVTSKGMPVVRVVTYRCSAIHGRGVFARGAIPDGARILEYTGERISKVEAGRREAQRLERRRRGGEASVFIFVLNRRCDLDGRKSRSVAKFINHSCAPNCRPEVTRGRVWIMARRDIAIGEELTYDYGFPFNEWRQHPCRCGAPRCAGFIVAKDQRWRLRRLPRAERRLRDHDVVSRGACALGKVR